MNYILMLQIFFYSIIILYVIKVAFIVLMQNEKKENDVTTLMVTGCFLACTEGCGLWVCTCSCCTISTNPTKYKNRKKILATMCVVQHQLDDSLTSHQTGEALSLYLWKRELWEHTTYSLIIYFKSICTFCLVTAGIGSSNPAVRKVQ